MTKSETMKVLAELQEYYPREVPNPEARANAWLLILKDFSAAEVQNAVIEFVKNDTKGFPPSPGQISSLIPRRALPEITDEQRRQIAIVEEGRRRAEKYHAAGLRTPGEAKEAGVCYSAWVMECEERMAKRGSRA